MVELGPATTIHPRGGHTENGLLPNTVLSPRTVWREAECQGGCAGFSPALWHSRLAASVPLPVAGSDLLDPELSVLQWQSQVCVS